MNMILYKNGIRGSLKLLLILASVLAMYFVLIIAMFDPELGAALNELAKSMPQIMAMFGMDEVGSGLIGFMSNYLYGFIMLVLPMVFSILTANRLVAKQVEQGSMAYLLAAPVSRLKIAFTQMKVLGSGVFVLVGFATLVGYASAKVLFPGELDTGLFLLINFGALCLQFFISGICFLASCIFNDTKYSVGLGAGIPALAFILQMMANIGNELEKAKYTTFFTLFNPDGIIKGENTAFGRIIALAVGAIALYTTAILVFAKKDMPV